MPGTFRGENPSATESSALTATVRPPRWREELLFSLAAAKVGITGRPRHETASARQHDHDRMLRWVRITDACSPTTLTNEQRNTQYTDTRCELDVPKP